MIKALKIKLSNTLYFVSNFHAIRKADILILDTPVHKNLGDQAIAIAQRQYLSRLCPNKKVFEIPANRIDGFEKILSKLISSKVDVLIHGGGFLGCIWKQEEYRFRRIIKSFKNNHIVVFPQTVTFDLNTLEGIHFFEESYEVYRNHEKMTLFLREEISYDFVKKHMPEVKAFLCPDIVLLLDVPINRGKKENQILLCMRSDIEKKLDIYELTCIENILKNMFLDCTIKITDTVLRDKKVGYIDEKNRNYYVISKINEFAKANLVVTDRLHGMIFSLLAGTECIAFNNKNGKVGNVYKWIREYKYIHMVNNVDEFVEVLESINFDKYNKYNAQGLINEFEILNHELMHGNVAGIDA